MAQDKVPVLVVVHDGAVETYAPGHADVRVVYLHNTTDNGNPLMLPVNVGFEKLAEQAGLEIGEDVVFEQLAREEIKLPKPVELWCFKCDVAFDSATAVSRCPQCGQLTPACDICAHRFDGSVCDDCHGGSGFNLKDDKPAIKPKRRKSKPTNFN